MWKQGWREQVSLSRPSVQLIQDLLSLPGRRRTVPPRNVSTPTGSLLPAGGSRNHHRGGAPLEWGRMERGQRARRGDRRALHRSITSILNPPDSLAQVLSRRLDAPSALPLRRTDADLYWYGAPRRHIRNHHGQPWGPGSNPGPALKMGSPKAATAEALPRAATLCGRALEAMSRPAAHRRTPLPKASVFRGLCVLYPTPKHLRGSWKVAISFTWATCVCPMLLRFRWSLDQAHGTVNASRPVS